MIKKLITILFLALIIILNLSGVFAQRMIDPTLKPINAPDTPKTGINKEECYTKYKDSELGFTFDSKTGEMVDLSKEEVLKMVWDENSQTCYGSSAAEPINAYIQIIGGALLMLSAGIAVIVIAVGGILYITSHGNQNQMEKAKSTLVYGIMGMLIIIFSYFIVRWVITLVTQSV